MSATKTLEVQGDHLCIMERMNDEADTVIITAVAIIDVHLRHCDQMERVTRAFNEYQPMLDQLAAAGAKVRELEAINAELVAALNWIEDNGPDDAWGLCERAREALAIAKAEAA